MNSRRLTIASAKPNQLYVRNVAQINPVLALRLRLCHAPAWRHLLRASQPDQRPGQSLLPTLSRQIFSVSGSKYFVRQLTFQRYPPEAVIRLCLSVISS